MISRNSPAEVRHSHYLVNNLKRLKVLVQKLESQERSKLYSDSASQVILELMSELVTDLISELSNTLDEDNNIIAAAISVINNAKLSSVTDKIELDRSQLDILSQTIDLYIYGKS